MTQKGLLSKTVMVTGASSGIGKATAMLFAKLSLIRRKNYLIYLAQF